MRIDCLLCGVGGQGTVLAAKLLAYAARQAGEPVSVAETIGMAQRGGSVTSHVRMGTGAYSSLIPLGKADVLIAFESAEAVRCFPYLSKTGVCVTAIKPVMPITGAYEVEEMLCFLRNNAPHLIEVDAELILRECDSPRVLNSVLLGAATAVSGMPAPEMLEAAVDALVKSASVDQNIRALRLGAKLGEKA